MKLTKEKRVYGAMLGIAVAALAADRLFGSGDKGGPMEAQANAAVYTAAPSTTSATVIAAPPAATVSVADQLASLDRKTHLDTAYAKNAFATWKSQPNHAAAAPTPVAAALAEQFRQDHHLTGVMIAGQRAFAVVDDGMVAVGQSVGGIKLTSVTQRSATWQTQDGASFVMAIEARRAAR